MTHSWEFDEDLEGFSGLVPSFPLPHVVLFPHALMPLHIFEPRYRRMVTDALDGERMIAMALTRPGWQKSASSTANLPLHQIMGLGKIIAHEKLEDGRYYLVLRGLARVKLAFEQPADLPYRLGHVDICQEHLEPTPTYDRQERAAELVSLFSQLFPEIPLKKLFLSASSDLPLQTLCDIILGAVPLPPEHSQQFMDDLDVDSRSLKLLGVLQGEARDAVQPKSRKFPPDFSAN